MDNTPTQLYCKGTACACHRTTPNVSALGIFFTFMDDIYYAVIFINHSHSARYNYLQRCCKSKKRQKSTIRSVTKYHVPMGICGIFKNLLENIPASGTSSGYEPICTDLPPFVAEQFPYRSRKKKADTSCICFKLLSRKLADVC